MKAVLLDGSFANDVTGPRVRAALESRLHTAGYDVEHIVLRDKNIAPCAGCFGCWTRTPGVCVIDDDNRAVARAVATSDLAVYLTPITFGGCSSPLKSAIDHLIQNISPFFTRVAGETHHHRRYAHSPDLLAVGWLDAPDLQAQQIFWHLVQRNALNWRSERSFSAMAYADETDRELKNAAQRWLGTLANSSSAQRIDLPTSPPPVDEPFEVRNALLLVGSPRTRRSASNVLGSYLFEQLAARGIETETLYTHTAVRSAEGLESLLDAVDRADTIVLSFPLYVDSLPAPAIEVLESIAAHRQGQNPERRQAFAAIVNCGFPEAYQCNAALAICETFARQAGLTWAGGLAMSGGHRLDHESLAKGNGQAATIHQALALAAEALAEGRAIPQAARELMGTPVMPPSATWMYRLFGGLAWVAAAVGNKTITKLWQRPYQSADG